MIASAVQAGPPIPLSVSWYYPTNGETYTAPANIAVHAAVLDSTLVETVQYYANGTNLGTRTNTAQVILTNTSQGNPFELSWSNVPAGTYSLTAVATDASNTVVTSAPVSITVVAPVPPPPVIPLSVSWYYPTNGETYTAPANIAVHAAVLDSTLVETVQYYANGTNIGTRTNTSQVILTNTSQGNPFELSWSNVPAGIYSLTAVATDASNTVVTSAPVSITVVAPVPPPPVIPLSVSWYYPTNGETYTAPANIAVHAAILDSTLVETVQYYANGTNIGTRTNTSQVILTNTSQGNPFELSWSNVPAGTYSLTAVATDASNAVVTSAPVSITVVSVPLGVVIASPITGTTFIAPANIGVHAQVQDSAVVETVQYFIGTNSIGLITNQTGEIVTSVNTASPFYLLWSNVTAGAYTLTAVATDATGLSTTSAPVSITVLAPPTPPAAIPLSVSFYYPTNGEIYTAPASIGVHALVLDSTLVETVAYFANGTNIGVRSNLSNVALTNSSAENPFELNWSNVTAGTYSLTAVATDASGVVVTSTPVSITVTSPPPPPAIPFVVSFYYPTNGESYTAPAMVVIHALVLDSNVVKTVQYFANGNSLGVRSNASNVLLTNSSQGNPFELTWSNVMAGTFALTAVATDSTGVAVTSAPVSITVLPPPSTSVKSTLTLNISPLGAGKIGGEANQASLQVNKVYSVTAETSAGWVFANWSSGTNSTSLSVLGTNSTLSFIMTSNLVLQANFVTNPFPAVAGIYSGLFAPTNGVTEDSSGFVTVTVPTTSGGTYSGKLLLDGGSYAFSGMFNLNGDSAETVMRAGKTAVAVVLHINMTGLPYQITGAITDEAANGWSSALLAVRAADGNNFSGRYTLAFVPGTNATTNEPAGYGEATLAISQSGQVALTGTLADATAFSQSVPVGADGSIPLYASLYARQGSVMGWLQITNDPSIILGSSLSWIKPSSITATGFADTGVAAIGSLYVAPPSGDNILTLTNGVLIVGNGQPASTLVYSNLAIVSNRLVNLNAPGNPTNQLSVEFTPGTGAMTVAFRPTGTRASVVAKGVVLQDNPANNAAGWFFGPNGSGGFILQP